MDIPLGVEHHCEVGTLRTEREEFMYLEQGKVRVQDDDDHFLYGLVAVAREGMQM